MLRVGIGYDIHRLVKERQLVLGGVTIPYHLGLEGHSDADVLVHAIMDAMLGALSLPDIGYYFPEDNVNYRDISSLKLLEEVSEIIKKKSYYMINLDSVIIVQQPRISSYIGEMKNNIARVLQVKENVVGIKATTHEKLDAIGRNEGIAVQAVALLEKNG